MKPEPKARIQKAATQYAEKAGRIILIEKHAFVAGAELGYAEGTKSQLQETDTQLKLEKVTLLTQNALILAAERRGFEEGAKSRDGEVNLIHALLNQTNVLAKDVERRGFDQAIEMLREIGFDEGADFLQSKIKQLYVAKRPPETAKRF